MIRFNKPYIVGKEVDYIEDSMISGHLSGNGPYTKKCQAFFENKLGSKKTLLTTSCTDALEMAAILLQIKTGDEVIVPSYTFVSSALAFVRQGAKIVFADSRNDHPGIDEDKIESLITKKTRAIVVVHYAGVACDMNKVMDLAEKYNLYVVEDAAQSIDSYFINHDNKKSTLGSIGHLSTFSFHETKNIQCGEGGLLAINDKSFLKRAEIIWEKGTNRAKFYRGEIDKYGWVDVGSSFLPSEMNAAFLYAQLEYLKEIQGQRLMLWERYHLKLAPVCKRLGIKQPVIPSYAKNNAHMYYLLLNNKKQRDRFIAYLKKKKIHAVFHYLSLHKSKYYKDKHDGRPLKMADYYSDTLVRLPFYVELSNKEQNYIIEMINEFEG